MIGSSRKGVIVTSACRGGPEGRAHRKFIEDLQGLIPGERAHGDGELAELIQELVETLHGLLRSARARSIAGPARVPRALRECARPTRGRAARRAQMQRCGSEVRAQLAVAALPLARWRARGSLARSVSSVGRSTASGATSASQSSTRARAAD